MYDPILRYQTLSQENTTMKQQIEEHTRKEAEQAEQLAKVNKQLRRHQIPM